MSSHTLGLSWDSILESIQMALNNGATTSTAKFSPLNLELKSFVRDRFVSQIVMEYDIPEGEKSQLQASVYQLVEHFPRVLKRKDTLFCLTMLRLFSIQDL